MTGFNTPLHTAANRRLRDRLNSRLEGVERNGQQRILRPPAGIDLASNDYLGLASHPLLKEHMAEAVMAGGVGSTGSRLLRGERLCTSDLERRFAAFKQTDRALYFSSGYLANLAALSTIPEAGDVIFSDQCNHASLIDGIRMSKAERVVFPHNDLGVLARLLHESPCEGERFVVVESLYSMEGDFAPLVELAALCATHNAALIVDEAHAIGLYGERGSGRIEKTGTGDSVFLSVNPAGKALGVAGAFVAGDETAIEYLLQRARTFIFSTAAPPAISAALNTSLDVIGEEPERRKRVRELARWFRGQLTKHDDSLMPVDQKDLDSPIVPILIGDSARAVRIAETLQSAGFDIRAIRPPTVPEGTARLRVSIHAGLDQAILTQFLNLLTQTLERVS